MTNITTADVAAAIKVLRAAFPNYNPDPQATPEIFLNVLGDLDADLFRHAILVCISEPGRAFAPSVGEIRGAAIKLTAQIEQIPSAVEALAEVLYMPKSMERLGVEPSNNPDSTPWVITHTKLSWSHWMIEKVAKLMGWPDSFPTDNAGVDRAQWERTYNSEVERYLSTRGQLPMIDNFVQAARAANQLQITDGTPEKVRLTIDDLKKGMEK